SGLLRFPCRRRRPKQSLPIQPAHLPTNPTRQSNQPSHPPTEPPSWGPLPATSASCQLPGTPPYYASPGDTDHPSPGHATRPIKDCRFDLARQLLSWLPPRTWPPSSSLRGCTLRRQLAS